MELDDNLIDEDNKEHWIDITNNSSIVHIETQEEYLARKIREERTASIHSEVMVVEKVKNVQYSDVEEANLYKRLRQIDTEIQTLEEQLISIRVFGN